MACVYFDEPRRIHRRSRNTVAPCEPKFNWIPLLLNIGSHSSTHPDLPILRTRTVGGGVALVQG
jgi:hypothetical protein